MKAKQTKNHKPRGPVFVDFGAADKKRLERIAKQYGFTVSEIVRRCCQPLLTGKVSLVSLIEA